MKCAFHPEMEAKAFCAGCQKPLCDACTLSTDKNQPLCSGCAALRAARDILKDVQERDLEKETLSREKSEKHKKKVMLYRAGFMILVLAAAAANVILYLSREPIQEGEAFIPLEDPLSAAVIIDAAIRDYADDHQGRFPQSLEELVGPYLSSEVFQPADLARFSYQKAPVSGYELRAREIEGDGTQKIIFSQKNIE